MTIAPTQKSLSATLLLAALVGTAACAPKSAPEANAEPIAAELPAAEDLFIRSLDAVGGPDALTSTATSRTEMAMSVPMAGMVGSVTVTADSGKLHVTHSIPGATEGVLVYDGERAWSVDSLMGPRLIEGDELRQLQMDNDPLGPANFKAWYPTRTTLGEREFGGESAWAVEATTSWGRVDTLFFSVDSGLALGTSTMEATPMGNMAVTNTFSNYSQFGAALVPTTIVQQAGPMEIVITVESIDLEPELDETLWAPPAEVVELLEELAQEAAESAGEEAEAAPEESGEAPEEN